MRLLVLAALAVPIVAHAYAPPPPYDYAPVFDLAGTAPQTTPAGGSAGSTIAATSDGALVLDGDSGALIAVDGVGARTAALALDAGEGLLVLDRTAHRAYVTERRRDRIAIVDVQPGKLALVAELATPGEPFGIALAPDGQTLYATAIADRVLVAYDLAHRTERWRQPVGAEPRAVAVAPDGKRAVVAHLTTGSIELLDLDAQQTTVRDLRHEVSGRCAGFHHGPKSESVSCPDNQAASVARGAYAATFLGNDVAVVAFQRESPVPRAAFAATQHYGGSAIPVTRQLAFVGVAGGQAVAQIAVREPRALAWDPARDVLYVAGRGSDAITAIDHASHKQDTTGSFTALEEAEPCGVDGLAIADNGDLLVWCGFSRNVLRFAGAPLDIVKRGLSVTTSRLTAEQHAGFERFYRATGETSSRGRVACASCHLDGRSDGLAWQVDGMTLRTPVLAGRLAGTAPYKWSGRDGDLAASLASTVKRLGGLELEDAPPDPILAYLATLAPIHPPARPAAAVARGKALFASSELGCAGCHSGPMFTDRQSHEFDGAKPPLDTPSLRGVAAAPRYLHDGSAATLDDVLAERGSIQGMIARPLTAAERADLAAYLESL